MGQRIVLFAAAIVLFVFIVGSAAAFALVGNGRSLPSSTLAQVEQAATAVTNPLAPQPDSASSRLTTPRAVPFPEGSLNHSFFILTGGHQPVDCMACHPSGDYQGTDPDCVACHASDDPHAGEYGSTCANCHVVESWQLAMFDHQRLGEQDCVVCHAPPANHYQGACRDCHTDTTDFRNVTFNHAGLTDCLGCHVPPADHFPGQCANCHSTTSWEGASFNHTFPIYHEGADGNCATCHPGGETAVYTCTACHNQQEMNEEHDEETGYTGNNCTQCHADGREHDDGGGDDHNDDDDDDDDDDD